MQILTILWQPNARWDALDDAAKRAYLRSLDAPISAARAAGVIVLGWSRVDARLPKSPAAGFVGVFATSDAEQALALETAVEQAGWYEYFDSTNVSVALEGATEGEPHRVYARLLDVPLS